VPRKQIDITKLAPQALLDYLIQYGAATATVDALLKPPVGTHWRRMVVLSGMGIIAAQRGWARIAVHAQLWLIYEYGFVTGALVVQKQVNRHFEAAGLEYGVSAILDWYLQQALSGQVYLPTVVPIAIKPVQGARVASTRIDTPKWTDAELAEELPGLIDRLEARYRREHTVRPRWLKDLAELMHGTITVRTLQRYLLVNTELQDRLNGARARVEGKVQIRVV